MMADEKRLLKFLYIAVVLVIVVPTLGGAAISMLAGHIEFPGFLYGFLGAGGAFAVSSLLTGLLLVRWLHSHIVALAKENTPRSRARLEQYVVLLPAAFVFSTVLFQVVGAALHHYSIDGPNFLTNGIYLNILPLLASRSVFAWSLPPLIISLDALGRFLAPRGIAIGTYGLRLKIIALGLLSPLMVSVLVAEFVIPAPGDLTPEILSAYGVALVIAVSTTWLVWRSTSAGITPLRDYIASKENGDTPDGDAKEIVPRSLDEFGEFSVQLRTLERRGVSLGNALKENERDLIEAHRIARLTGFVIDTAGQFRWRGEPSRLLGNQHQEVSTLHDFCSYLADKPDAEDLKTTVERCWDDLQSFTREFELTVPERDRVIVRLHAQVVVGQENKSPRLIGMLQDVTEFRLLEETLRQSQKMEALGNLTGGIAHDFNNLLAAIRGSLDVIGLSKLEPQQAEFLDHAQQAIDRSVELTRNLLTFARRAPLKPQPLDLNLVVHNTHNWAGRVIPRNIVIETALPDDLWSTRIDASSTENALLNLMLNASDAMPDGGTLKITTENARISANTARAKDDQLPPGDYVALSVSDSGTGIARCDLHRIFEPFFTTKAQGKGTGLGLASVAGFVQQSGGIVAVDSEVGVGTTFKLYFPALLNNASADPPKSAPTITPRAGTRIMVAEDNSEFMRVLVTILGDAGYDVVPAISGDDALQAYARAESIDLLLTDLVMPGQVQGFELARQLRAKDPTLPVVFMSGYTNDTSDNEAGHRSDDIRLAKPVNRNELINAIETTLHGDRERIDLPHDDVVRHPLRTNVRERQRN